LRGRALRGEVWLLKRYPRKGGRGEILGELLDRLDPDKLPVAFSVTQPLERLFGKGRLHLGAKNPTPPPLLVEEFAIEAPVAQSPNSTPQKLPTLKELLEQRNGTDQRTSGVRYT
jgi:hypothetical protein